MSDLRAVTGPATGRPRRRRMDAERNVASILASATTVLGRRPDASMDEIAAAAGVARQTIYAHYPTRGHLLDAVVGHVTVEVVRTIDAATPDLGQATAALERWLDRSWSLLDRFPVLLQPSVMDGPVHSAQPYEVDRQLPIATSLLSLIQRGQTSGEFDRSKPVGWLLASALALGHAAGQEVTAGRLTAVDAGRLFRQSVLRVYGVRGAEAHE